MTWLDDERNGAHIVCHVRSPDVAEVGVILHIRDIEMPGVPLRVRGVLRVLSRALQTSEATAVINTPRGTVKGAVAVGGAAGGR